MKAPRFVHLTYDKRTANDVIDNFIPIGLSKEIALREKQTIFSFIDELMEVRKTDKNNICLYNNSNYLFNFFLLCVSFRCCL